MISITGMTRVAKAYLELDGLLFLLLIIWDQHAGGGSLYVGWLSGTIADDNIISTGG